MKIVLPGRIVIKIIKEKTSSHGACRRVGRQDDTNMGEVLKAENGYPEINFTSCTILPKTGTEDDNTGKKLQIVLRLTNRYILM